MDESTTVRPCRKTDAPWIVSWFDDPVLDRALGPVDADWVSQVVADQDGVHLVAEVSGSPLGLVGVSWDPAGVHPHVLTDIAVDPTARRRGTGRRVLDAAVSWPGHPPTRSWMAFVDPDNPGAFAFFTALGWRHEGVEDEMHRFVRDGS